MAIKLHIDTVGYKEMFAYFDGVWTFEEAIERLKGNTRRYARKQLTWFKKDPEMRWFNIDDNQLAKNKQDIINYIYSE